MIFAGPLERARYQARVVSRRIVLGAIGGFFVLIGLVFMAVALWITLADIYGTRATAVIVGLTCMGIGFLTIALSYRRPRLASPEASGAVRSAPPDPTTVTVATLVNAFVMGLRAGRYRSSRRRRS